MYKRILTTAQVVDFQNDPKAQLANIFFNAGLVNTDTPFERERLLKVVLSNGDVLSYPPGYDNLKIGDEITYYRRSIEEVVDDANAEITSVLVFFTTILVISLVAALIIFFL